MSSSSGSDPARASLSPPTTMIGESPPAASDASGVYALESYGTTVHPMLVDQMRSFEGELDTQIYNAQQAFYLANASSSETSAASGGGHSPSEGQYIMPYEQPQDQEWRWNSEQMPPPPVPSNASHARQQHPRVVTSHLEAPRPHHPSVSPASSGSSPAERAYAVPMYGAVEGGSLQVPGEGHAYIPRGPAPESVPPMAALQPDPASVGQQPQSQLWQVPPSYAHHPQQQYHNQAQYEQYNHYHHPTPTNSRPRSAHGSGYSQHHATPPAPPALALHGQGQAGQAGYNLQDTWNSFFQHELPAPPGGPGPSRSTTGRR